MRSSLFTATLFFCFLSINAQQINQSFSIWNNSERPLPDPTEQFKLNEAKLWTSFTELHGGWYAEFDEITKIPIISFGNPIPVNSSSEEFLKEDLFGRLLKDFRFDKNEFNKTTEQTNRVAFKQYHKGIEIFNSLAVFEINVKSEVYAIRLNAFPRINLDLNPGINSTEVKSKFRNHSRDELSQLILEKNLLIIPVRDRYRTKYVYRLAYRGILSENLNGIPADWDMMVDANTGDLLYKQNLVLSCTEHFASHDREFKENHGDHIMNPQLASATPSKLMASVLFNANDPDSLVGLPYVEASLNGTSYFSDSLGNISLPSIGTATFPLKGKFAQILDRSRGNKLPSFQYDLANTTGTLLFNGRDSMDQEQLSTYHHTTVMHNFVNFHLGPNAGLDSSIISYVKRGDGTCNAFVSLFKNYINYYLTGGGCYSFSLFADIVYHEYGHLVNRQAYNSNSSAMINGAIHEGYSDLWAIALSKNLVLGKGGRIGDTSSNTRRYDANPKVFPQNYVNEQHGDGEIICGAWLDLSKVIGMKNMMEIFVKTFKSNAAPDAPNSTAFGLGRLFREILLEALIADDTDGDLTNGTQNSTAILKAFSDHGISLFPGFKLEHEPVLSAPLITALDISIKAKDFSKLSNSSNTSIYLNYRDSIAKLYTKIKMNPSGPLPDYYAAQIPGRSNHGVISYFISVEDSSGIIITDLPRYASFMSLALPYYILYGYAPRMAEDFEGGQNSLGTWLLQVPGDNAQSGTWIIDSPIGSYVNEDSTLSLVQTDKAKSGSKSALTGNAANVLDPMTTNSVKDGTTTLRTPVIDLSTSVDPVICYDRWFSNSAGAYQFIDYLKVQIINGSLPWKNVENTNLGFGGWKRNAIRLRDYYSPNDKIQLQFVVKQKLTGLFAEIIDPIVEVALDDLNIYDVALTDLEDVFLEGSIWKIYPNPVSEILNIERLDDAHTQIFSISIVDELGRVVMKRSEKIESGRHKSIDLSQLSFGTYALIIAAEKEIIRKKILII